MSNREWIMHGRNGVVCRVVRVFVFAVASFKHTHSTRLCERIVCVRRTKREFSSTFWLESIHLVVGVCTLWPVCHTPWSEIGGNINDTRHGSRDTEKAEMGRGGERFCDSGHAIDDARWWLTRTGTRATIAVSHVCVCVWLEYAVIRKHYAKSTWIGWNVIVIDEITLNVARKSVIKENHIHCSFWRISQRLPMWQCKKTA